MTQWRNKQVLGIAKEEAPDIKATDGIRLLAYNKVLDHLIHHGYTGINNKKLKDKNNRGLTINGHALRQIQFSSIRVHVCSSPAGFYIIQAYGKAESSKQNNRRIEISKKRMKAYFEKNFR